jgi:hypothetical protein
MIFNHYESGELPRKCGMNAPYRILYCRSEVAASDENPMLNEPDILLMLFKARIAMTWDRIGMDNLCMGMGFITEAFCRRVGIVIRQTHPLYPTLPFVKTGNGSSAQAIGYVIVQVSLGSHLSKVTFFVFGKFAGSDAVLGHDWLKLHEVNLEMGTGRIVIRDGARKHVISSISTKVEEDAYNRTPRAIIGEAVDYQFNELQAEIPVKILGKACTRLFNLIHTKKVSFDNKVVQAVLCHSSVVGSVIYEEPLGPGGVSKIKKYCQLYLMFLLFS